MLEPLKCRSRRASQHLAEKSGVETAFPSQRRWRAAGAFVEFAGEAIVTISSAAPALVAGSNVARAGRPAQPVSSATESRWRFGHHHHARARFPRPRRWFLPAEWRATNGAPGDGTRDRAPVAQPSRRSRRSCRTTVMADWRKRASKSPLKIVPAGDQGHARGGSAGRSPAHDEASCRRLFTRRGFLRQAMGHDASTADSCRHRMTSVGQSPRRPFITASAGNFGGPHPVVSARDRVQRRRSAGGSRRVFTVVVAAASAESRRPGPCSRVGLYSA